MNLKWITKIELNWILDYIYNGQSVLDQSEIENFLKKGNLLGLVGFQQDIISPNILQVQDHVTKNSIKNENDSACETTFIDNELTDEKRTYP